jgi:hypothetical protein
LAPAGRTVGFVLHVAMLIILAMLVADLFQRHWARAAIDAVLLAVIVWARSKRAVRKLPADAEK